MVLLLEDINLQQLLHSPVSPSIQAYSDERQKIQGPTTETTEFLDTIYDPGKDIVIFKFLTEATEKYGAEHPYKDTNPVSTPPFGLEGNPSKSYEIWIGFYPLKEKLTGILAGAEPSADNVKQALNDCFIRIWSSAPSFHYQGFNFNLSRKGAALFPTNMPPEKWKNVHGQGLLDKHTLELVTSLPFYMNQFAQAVLNKIRR